MATDIPKVREHRHPEGEGAHSLTNLSVKNLAGSFAEFNSKEAHSLPDLINIGWRMDIRLDLTNLSWRMRSGETVGKLDSGIYLVQVGNGGNITENSAEFNITGTHSLTSFTNLRLKETPGKVIEKLNFGNCLVIVDLRWREDKPGEGVEKLYFNIYLVSAEGGTEMTRGGSQLRAKAEGERKMTRGIGRISTSAVKEKVEGERKMTRGIRRISTSAVKEKVYTFNGELKKAGGGDGRDRDKRKGADRLRRRYDEKILKGEIFGKQANEYEA